MNIKITKEEAEELFKRETNRVIMGSRLYGSNNEDSDIDFLVLYKAFDRDINQMFQIRHQFQFDDEDNNIDFIFSTTEQFAINTFSGESTINSDIVLFTDFINKKEEDRLKSCRTYNIIKAYLGFAKRDIKYNKNNSRYKHIVRGLYTASCLLNNIFPNLEDIKTIQLDNFSKNNEELKLWQNELRLKCNQMYEKDELKMYPDIFVESDDIHPLQMKLIQSCNTKEFRYGD
jgi:predicted nucleotidyltransferase